MDAVYIHVPFCIKKCAYCDFLSYSFNREKKEKYVESLLKEIELYPKWKYKTVYFGGGTPSLLDSSEIKSIIDKFEIEEDAEITLELNPGTVDRRKLQEFYDVGINRLSIGVQSFNDKTLKMLGRIHNVEKAVETYKTAREIGFKNISLDLIFAVPEQTLEDLEYDLRVLTELNPEHISIYSLIWEEGTPFYEMRENGVLKEAENELEAMMYEKIMEYLNSKGYIHYEISSFAKEGYESRHNSCYWENKDYLGLGPSATGYIDRKRYTNTSDLEEYCNKILKSKKPVEYFSIESEDEIEDNRVILGFRFLNRGVEVTREKDLIAIKRLMELGLIDRENGLYYLNRKGVLYANEVFMAFV